MYLTCSVTTHSKERSLLEKACEHHGTVFGRKELVNLVGHRLALSWFTITLIVYECALAKKRLKCLPTGHVLINLMVSSIKAVGIKTRVGLNSRLVSDIKILIIL